MGQEWTGHTEFASAARSVAEELLQQRQTVSRAELFQPLLEAVPGMAFVLNEHRQIVGANQRALTTLELPVLDPIVGQRPGELFGCVVAETAPSGCGTARECAFCGAAQAIVQSLQTQQPAQRECRLRTRGANGGAFELDVQASFIAVDGAQFLVVGLRDLSHEKRRHLLERTFFHDVMNTAGGVQGLAEILAEMEGPVEEDELKQDLTKLADQLVEEITTQRQLLAAESGELQVRPSDVSARALLGQVMSACGRLDVAQRRGLTLDVTDDITLWTDAVLLRRVLVNLVKNALEACPPGGTVTIGAGPAENDAVRFAVHNPGMMPPSVQAQLFQRSFSTKGGSGRGVGTFSVKLFCEGFLGGQVGYASSEQEGTTFTATIPQRLTQTGRTDT